MLASRPIVAALAYAARKYDVGKWRVEAGVPRTTCNPAARTRGGQEQSGDANPSAWQARGDERLRCRIVARSSSCDPTANHALPGASDDRAIQFRCTAPPPSGVFGGVQQPGPSGAEDMAARVQATYKGGQLPPVDELMPCAGVRLLRLVVSTSQRLTFFAFARKNFLRLCQERRQAVNGVRRRGVASATHARVRARARRSASFPMRLARTCDCN